MSYQGRGHEMAHNLSYNHSILFKIVSVETFSNVDYTHLIHLGFTVIKKILESNNSREVRFCLNKSLDNFHTYWISYSFWNIMRVGYPISLKIHTNSPKEDHDKRWSDKFVIRHLFFADTGFPFPHIAVSTRLMPNY